jgi:predicted amidophosphoribosyltransferase
MFCRRCTLDQPVCTDRRCGRCFRELTKENQECLYCKISASPLSSERFIWSYEARAAEYLRKAKYTPDPFLFGYLCRRAVQQLQKEMVLSDYDLILAIPSMSSSILQKGYIPAATFAAQICRKFFDRRLTLRERMLIRPGQRRTARLATLPAQRRTREAAKMEIGRLYDHERNILLVDDLVTTGASSRVAATLLRARGAEEVHLVSLMRREPYFIPNFARY